MVWERIFSSWAHNILHECLACVDLLLTTICIILGSDYFHLSFTSHLFSSQVGWFESVELPGKGVSSKFIVAFLKTCPPSPSTHLLSYLHSCIPYNSQMIEIPKLENCMRLQMRERKGWCLSHFTLHSLDTEEKEMSKVHWFRSYKEIFSFLIKKCFAVHLCMLTRAQAADICRENLK